MKQLENFQTKLWDAGFTIKTNWQQVLNQTHNSNHKSIIEHCTIIKDNKWVMVLFHVYAGDNGFEMYIQTEGNDISEDIEKLKTRLKLSI